MSLIVKTPFFLPYQNPGTIATFFAASVFPRSATLDPTPSGLPAHGFWFGEDQARYVVTAPEGDVAGILARASQPGVVVRRIGRTGGHEGVFDLKRTEKGQSHLISHAVILKRQNL